MASACDDLGDVGSLALHAAFSGDVFLVEFPQVALLIPPKRGPLPAIPRHITLIKKRLFELVRRRRVKIRVQMNVRVRGLRLLGRRLRGLRENRKPLDQRRWLVLPVISALIELRKAQILLVFD